tara:strand:+ start:3085 stop:4110 length:1026 start_codon:yes stop_codon:yes gene_type:complete
MSVEYILDRFGKKIGMSPSDTSQRGLLLDYLNEAAQELYEQSDMPGCLEEAEFYVQGNKTVAMPADVYAIRGIREKAGTNAEWETEALTARYRENSWETNHNKFRIKGYSPLKISLPTSITEAANSTNKLIVKTFGITTTSDDFEVVVKTPYSEAFLVSVTGLSAVTSAISSATNTLAPANNVAITDIISFSRTLEPTATSGLVQLLDYADNTIVYAEILSNSMESRYLIIDVSEFPFSSTAGQDDSHTLQVLYKKTLPRLQNDTDEFPAIGYDNILVSKCMELFLEEQGKVEEAILHDRKATRSLSRRQADLERSQEQKVVFKRHNHDKLSWLATHNRRS